MSANIFGSNILGPLFLRDEYARIFCDHRHLSAMLGVEAALARAEARLGIIPAEAAQTIEAKCASDLFDMAALGQATAKAGNPVIPMVKMLTALAGPQAGRYVHWGATTQDIMDTAMVEQMRSVFGLMEDDLNGLMATLVALARAHRDTPMAGRTFMQHALPTTFGYRVAGWLSALLRFRERTREIAPRLFVVQFGGAVGTLASLGLDGPAVQQALAEELGLGVPDMPWHTARDRLAEAAGLCGLLAGTLAKMARDIALLMQSEIGEVNEPVEEGRGGSSTLPQKRNPIGCAAILASCEEIHALGPVMLRAMAQEHERGTGTMHAEWFALPQIAMLAGSALGNMRELTGGLSVDAARMRANLEDTGGLIMSEAAMMALAPKLGRLAAHHKVADAVKIAIAEKRHLRDVLAGDRDITRIIDATALERLFDPATYTGSAGLFVDTVAATAEKAIHQTDA